MSPIEVLAVLFALLVLTKIITVLVNPNAWIKVVDPIYKNPTFSIVVYLVLVVVTGYYLLQRISVVELGAAMMFTAFLMGIGFLPYSKILVKMRSEFLSEGVKKAWLSLAIWAVLALWVLYAVFF